MVLGNPAPREEIERLLSIQQPEFFQVSLEGMPEHNDSVRGQGHFHRTMKFLDLLRELGVYSMVMLTLTRENVRQVLPLAGLLSGHADVFTFNRLSQVGEGASLQLPSRDEYAAFLKEYLDASNTNPGLGLKDNLLNLVLRRKGLQLQRVHRFRVRSCVQFHALCCLMEKCTRAASSHRSSETSSSRA
jgi:sulfatase maturation enzyme AslB (radical SAM superfamily)